MGGRRILITGGAGFIGSHLVEDGLEELATWLAGRFAHRLPSSGTRGRILEASP